MRCRSASPKRRCVKLASLWRGRAALLSLERRPTPRANFFIWCCRAESCVYKNAHVHSHGDPPYLLRHDTKAHKICIGRDALIHSVDDRAMVRSASYCAIQAASPRTVPALSAAHTDRGGRPAPPSGRLDASTTSALRRTRAGGGREYEDRIQGTRVCASCDAEKVVPRCAAAVAVAAQEGQGQMPARKALARASARRPSAEAPSPYPRSRSCLQAPSPAEVCGQSRPGQPRPAQRASRSRASAARYAFPPAPRRRRPMRQPPSSVQPNEAGRSAEALLPNATSLERSGAATF